MWRGPHGVGRPRPLRLALVAIAATTLLTAFIEVVFAADSSFDPRWLIMAVPGLGVVNTAAGLEAWRRRPSNLTGPLLVFGGWTWLLAGLEGTDERVLVAISLCMATLPVAVMVHVVMAFPSGRVGPGLPLAVTTLAYVTATILQPPRYLFRPSAIMIADRPNLDEVFTIIQLAARGVVMVGVVVVIVGRLRTARPTNRPVLVPLYVYGVIAIAAIHVAPILERWVFDFNPVRLAIVQFALAAVFPLAFAIGLVRGFARTGEVEELGARLAASFDRTQLTTALADALGDPSAEVAFWMPEQRRYVDDTGNTVDSERGDRAIAPVDLGDRHVGVIMYDRTLLAEPDVPRQASRVLAIALDRERLMVELVTSRDAVRESRARLVAATEQERRRIARDLHDGLQARLVLLSLHSAQLAQSTGADPKAVLVRDGLAASVDELRAMVHGVMPPLLLERGLYAATQDLVERMPLPTALQLDGAQPELPPTVESTAFFVVAEALSNVVKHSSADHVWVRLVHDDSVLRIEVEDDGIGGVGRADGSGLRGIEDRIDVLGGQIQWESPRGVGTLVRAIVPCGRAAVSGSSTVLRESRPPRPDG